ncbi:MAG: DNA polymerase III subunit beta [bacterium]|nr:DNA polymerase III subunit beta [bacterium]
MKLKIKKEVLLDGLNKVSKAISTKNLVPVLAGIKFDLEQKGLTLTASDNDITIQVFIEKEEYMDIDKDGSIIIQGKYILDIVRKLPDEFINIEVVDDLKIIIYTENSEFNLNGISKSEYPNINLEESKKPLEIDAKVFKTVINQTSFASSNDESRPILTGINFKIVGDLLECNSTDSYRLARKIIHLNTSIDENYNIVIPSKNLLEFIKIMDESEENIQLHVFNNKILIKYQNILFQSRLISGTYPNTTNLLPDEFLLAIKTDISELYSVIDRASILTSDKEKNIVTFEIDGNKLFVRSSSAEIGKVEEKMTIDKNNNENLKISFVAKYMMEALKSFDDDKVEISFVGEVKPIILNSKKDDGLTQLVLPIRTY